MNTKSKKFISLLLVLSMIFTMTTTASAKIVGSDGKVALEISTDEAKYSWGDEIVFNIEVTNISNETLNGIRICSMARNIYKIIGDKYSPIIDELAPGESTTIQMTYVGTRIASFL